MANVQRDSHSTLPITYRPQSLAVAGWFAASTLIGVAFYLVFHVVLAVPIWEQIVVGFVVVAAFFSSVLTARSFVEFSDEGITQRFLFTRHYDWASLNAWTQWSNNGGIFIVRTITGNVFGFNHWCVFGSRHREVCTILNRYIGAETKGDEAILPAIPKGLANMVMFKLTQDATEQRDAVFRVTVALLATCAILGFGYLFLNAWVNGRLLGALASLTIALAAIPWTSTETEARNCLCASAAIVVGVVSAIAAVLAYFSMFNFEWFDRIFNDEGTGTFIGLLLFGGIGFAIGGWVSWAYNAMNRSLGQRRLK